MKLGLVFGVVLFTGCATQELTTTQEDRFDPSIYKKVRADRHGADQVKAKCKKEKKEGEE